MNALKHRRRAQRTGYLDRQSVVHLVGRIAAYLAERVLYFIRDVVPTPLDMQFRQ